MSLFKDLSNNLNKILMQSNKSSLQLEKTIVSTKTSIKNIKDVKLNFKKLKVNNDKSNKAFNLFNLSSIELFDKIDKYLKNPTPAKALKVKNQINVSNDYLTNATTIFSEDKTFLEKVVVSLKEYKNGDFIKNTKESIEFNQRLILSFKKNIKITTPVSKLKTKTRKVYFDEEATPDPACPKYKKTLADKEKERGIIEKELKVFADKAKLRDSYKDDYEARNIKKLKFIRDQRVTLIALSENLNQIIVNTNDLKKINDEISKILKKNQLAEVPTEKDKNLLMALLTKQQETLNLIQINKNEAGSNTEESLSNQYKILIDNEKELQDNSNDYKKWEKINSELISSEGKIKELTSNKQTLTTEISDLEKIIKDLKCP
jgi:hypothetical protein